MTNVLKRELRLEGNTASVVRQAAEQCGIDANGRPLIELAAKCVALFGESSLKLCEACASSS
jgi:hypothetical protein